ncbi:MAG: hypothetical protein K6G01_05445 [Eubacterium sp.]|nr:hypothetical protein [Eubacterium sp.]
MSEIVGKYGSFIVESLSAVAILAVIVSYAKGGAITQLVKNVLDAAIGGVS